MNMALFETKSLSVGYSGKDVLSNVEIALNAGETVGLIGLNGAGKTTFIKTVLGLRKAVAGDFSINYQDDSAKNKLAYLPERFEPPQFLSGYEFIEFTLNVYGRKVDRDQIRMAIHDLAFDVVSLDKKVSTYSKGMRQKIGLLATILTSCPLMILDEPMSGLDPFSRSLVKELIKDEKAKGRSFLISSHILADMQEICDKIAIVDQGRVEFFGQADSFISAHKGENLERAFMNLIMKNRKIQSGN